MEWLRRGSYLLKSNSCGTIAPAHFVTLSGA